MIISCYSKQILSAALIFMYSAALFAMDKENEIIVSLPSGFTYSVKISEGTTVGGLKYKMNENEQSLMAFRYAVWEENGFIFKPRQVNAVQLKWFGLKKCKKPLSDDMRIMEAIDVHNTRTFEIDHKEQ